MKNHPLSETFPVMGEDEYDALKKDIKLNGLISEIVTHDGMILDGRHRFRACQELKIKPVFKKYEGNDPIGYVISVNLNRRHLNQSQRCVAVLSLYDKMSKEAKLKRHTAEHLASIDVDLSVRSNRYSRLTQNRIGKLFGVGGSTLGGAIMVRNRRPELLKDIMSGKLTISQARKMVPKIRDNKKFGESSRNFSKEMAINMIKSMDSGEALVFPDAFQTSDHFLNKVIPILNDHGYVLQTVFCGRKVYAQIVKFGENFAHWGNKHCEYDFRRAISVEWRDKIGNAPKKSVAA